MALDGGQGGNNDDPTTSHSDSAKLGTAAMAAAAQARPNLLQALAELRSSASRAIMRDGRTLGEGVPGLPGP